jgi:hypothetical protein
MVLLEDTQQEATRMLDFAGMLKQCKLKGEQLLGIARIHQVCREVGHRWRRGGKLSPATTVLGMMQQMAHANVSCAAVRQMHQSVFSAEAFCQARQRMPLAVLAELNRGLADALVQQAGQVSGKWKGRHRVFLIDGSGFLVPDTPELREYFGLRSNQKPGCGYPSCHLLLQLGPGGAATAAICSPYRTGDMTHVADADVQQVLGADDVVLGDRLFSNWGHFVLLQRRGAHGLFRANHSRKIEFGRYKDHGPNRRWLAKLGRCDQLVQYRKPDHKPGWMSQPEYENAPPWITVREVKVKVRINGQRKQVTMVTTLSDPKRYPAKDLIALLGQRWTIETNLSSLKTLMGLEQVRCKTVDGVKKELAAYLLVYNAVRLVMLQAADRQGVDVSRISFADALAWMKYHPHAAGLCPLQINPQRQGRVEPRRIKKRNRFATMYKSREELRQDMIHRRLAG